MKEERGCTSNLMIPVTQISVPPAFCGPGMGSFKWYSFECIIALPLASYHWKLGCRHLAVSGVFWCSSPFHCFELLSAAARVLHWQDLDWNGGQAAASIHFINNHSEGLPQGGERDWTWRPHSLK